MKVKRNIAGMNGSIKKIEYLARTFRTAVRRNVFLHGRQSKAESLVYQQRRATPYGLEYVASVKPCKGDILIAPLQGLGLWFILFRRALPCAELLKAFSLNLMAMGGAYAERRNEVPEYNMVDWLFSKQKNE